MNIPESIPQRVSIICFLSLSLSLILKHGHVAFAGTK